MSRLTFDDQLARINSGLGLGVGELYAIRVPNSRTGWGIYRNTPGGGL